MDVRRRRVGSVVAGSVWESRMRSDEVGGGVKVFSGEQSAEEGGNGGTRLKRDHIVGVVATGKRKTWKSERSEGLENNQIQIAIGKSEQCKDLNLSSDSTKNGPIQVRKVKNEGSKEIGASVSADKLVRSSIHTRRKRSEVGESSEKNIGQLRKNKSDSVKTTSANQSAGDGNAIQLKKDKSELNNVLEASRNEIDGSARIVIENENCKDFGMCQAKVIPSGSDNKCSPVHVDGYSNDEEEDEEEEVEADDEEFDIEMEKGNFDVEEISLTESKVMNEPERKEVVNVPEKQKILSRPEPKKVETTIRQIHQINERPVSVPFTVKPSSPIRKHSKISQNFSKADSIPKAEKYCRFHETQNNLQSLVDLIMWRDISRSAFIFGIGTFTIFSSSHAKDINLSLISVMSYISLVYLAVIFLYRSLICRGVIDVEDTNYVLGEEEAIGVLKLILPYLNEFLTKLRAMFSGDPGTTMKLAVLLFILARYGNFITIWKMAKFGFFGVFTVPKICSSCSAQLSAFANFWIRRFRDAWDSCSYKKAVALGIFGLVWNLSSVVARIWSVFVLFVAFRYYQQHYLVRDAWVEVEAECDETWQEPVGVKVGKQGNAEHIICLKRKK